MGNKLKVNTKIYTSIEEVVSDYEKKDYVNSLILFGYILSSPVRLNEDGGIHLEILKDSVSNVVGLLIDPSAGPLRGIDRNFLVKTSGFVPIMEKWSKLGLAYSEGVYKIVDFIKNGGYKWIAYSLGDYVVTSQKYLSHEEYDRSLVEKLKSAMVSSGDRFLSSFIEQVFRGWENRLLRSIERTMKTKSEFDFHIGENRDSFYGAAKKADKLFKEPENIFSWSYCLENNLIAILGDLWGTSKGNGNRGNLLYGKIAQYPKKVNEFLDKERERYEKTGVLPFYPEVFIFPERSNPYGLYIPCSRPEILEIGIVLLGHKERKSKDHGFEILFLPFVAAKTEPAVALSLYTVRTTRSDDPEQRPLYYYPVLMAYESEASTRKSPKFQIFSFTEGPVISSNCWRIRKDQKIYAPLVEHVYTTRKEDQSIGVRRSLVANSEWIYEIYEDRKFYERLLSKLAKLTDISYLSETKQRVMIDLTERNKIVEISSLINHLLEKIDQREERNSKLVFVDPSEINPKERTEILTNTLCYSMTEKGKTEKVQIKMIDEFTREEKELMKTGASVGGYLSIDPDESSVYLDKVKKLYDLILVSLRMLYQLGKDKTRGYINLIKELSEVSEELKKNYRISSRIGKEKIGLIARKSEVSSGIDILKTAKRYFTELSKSLEDEDGPNITVALEYSPKLEIYFPRDKCQGVDLDTLIDKELEVSDVHILSYLKRAAIFFDFEKEGLRVASINVVSTT
jgi:hypothetical protein